MTKITLSAWMAILALHDLDLVLDNPETYDIIRDGSVVASYTTLEAVGAFIDGLELASK